MQRLIMVHGKNKQKMSDSGAKITMIILLSTGRI